MLKKTSIFMSVLIGALFASEGLYAIDVLVEGKAAYFYPLSNKFRRIYSGNGIYGIEASVQAYRDLYAWAGADYFYANGHSIGSRDDTRIEMVPIGAGLKYFFPVSFVDIYLGAGILGTYVHIKDDSPFVIKSSNKWEVGGVAKAGALFNVTDHFFIDLFTNYMYTKVDFHNTDGGRVVRSDANLSGMIFGGGIGYRFGHKSKPQPRPQSQTKCKD